MKKSVALRTYQQLAITLLITLSYLPSANAAQQLGRSAYIAFGEIFTAHLQEENLDELDRLINLEAYGGRVAKTAFSDKGQITAFKKAFIKGISQRSFAKNVFFNFPTEGASHKFLGLTGRNRPLIRRDHADGGHEYFRLHVGPNEENKLQVYDFFFASTGAYSSVSVGAASQLLVNPNRSLLEKLFGNGSVDKELSKKFKKFVELRNKGNFQEAFDIVESFPKDVRNHEVLIAIAVGLAAEINDELYREELSRLAEAHGEKPKYAFMLIDHYFYQQDWVKALAAIKTAKRQWKDDGAMNVLHSTISNLAGNTSEALKYAKRAIEVEPDHEDAYWAHLDIAIKTGQFEAAVQTADVLTENFNMEFTQESMSGVPGYKGFADSKEFQDWLKRTH